MRARTTFEATAARLVIALACCCASALCGAASATADFLPIQLQSVGLLEQFESAAETAISGDGQYLTFEGTLAGVRGIYRKGLNGGQPQLVVGGSVYANSPLADAFAPSISEEGRYISFTSSAQLVKVANSGENVYVRDMDVPAPAGGGACDEEEEREENGRRCAYELASALNGDTEGLTYGSSLGAVASGRVALSASGREIVFVVDASSDLIGHEAGEPDTPGGQVVVRYLDRRETVLISAEREADGQMSTRAVAGGAVTATWSYAATQRPGSLPGAALSADGSTVAWLGANIPAQVPTLEGERQLIELEDHGSYPYDEPLWRRIEEGPAAPTRRMVGGGDPLAPGCPADGTLAMPACQGPFPGLTESRGEIANDSGWLGNAARYDGVPQLSADGWTAVLIGDPDSSSNVFLLDMHEGLDRLQALRQMTREVPVANLEDPGASSEYVSQAGNVYEAAISPDGRRIAFTTQRQQFPLAPPYFNEAQPAQLGVLELYQIDLTDESLVRVTHGPGTAPSNEGEAVTGVATTGASSPSYSADDLTLAFTDTASNLVAGDANHASDAFTVIYQPTLQSPGPVEIGSVSAGLEPARAQWRLSVVPTVRRDGSVLLQVDVPGPGTLSATARAAVPVASRADSVRGRDERPRSRAARSNSAAIAVRSRTVASARMTASLASLLELPLRVSPRYRALLGAHGGLYALVRVEFRGSGGPALTQTVAVTLRTATQARKVRRSKPTHARGGAGRLTRAPGGK
jgi:Tol biopolymer transport system component